MGNAALIVHNLRKPFLGSSAWHSMAVSHVFHARNTRGTLTLACTTFWSRKRNRRKKALWPLSKTRSRKSAKVFLTACTITALNCSARETCLHHKILIATKQKETKRIKKGESYRSRPQPAWIEQEWYPLSQHYIPETKIFASGMQNWSGKLEFSSSAVNI